MRFTIATVFALAGAALAQTPGFNVFSKPTRNEAVPVGKEYTVTWEPSTNYTGTVSISIIGGETQTTQQPLGTLATGLKNTGEFEWDVDEDLLGHKVYGLKISLDSDPEIFQWSHPFRLVGGSTPSSSASASSSAPSSASASSSRTPSSTPAPSSSIPVSSSVPVSSSSVVISSSSAPGNLSTSSRSIATVTSFIGAPSSTSSSTNTVSTNAAATAGGSLALLGGVAMAILAL